MSLLDKTRQQLAEYDTTLQQTESSLSLSGGNGQSKPADKIGRLRRQSTMLQSKLLQKQVGTASKNVRKVTPRHEMPCNIMTRVMVHAVCHVSCCMLNVAFYVSCMTPCHGVRQV